MNHKLCEQNVILLTDREKFINAASIFGEGEIYFSNPNYNLVGDYSKACKCGDLDTVWLYEVAHEKQLQRTALFHHFLTPFWANYDKGHTKLEANEKYLIFLKVIDEVKHAMTVYDRDEITDAIRTILEIPNSEIERLDNGKMWHDYYLHGYREHCMKILKKDKKDLYW